MSEQRTNVVVMWWRLGVEETETEIETDPALATDYATAL